MARIESTGRYVLFSAQKNEKPFLVEWIAYHKAIGFTDIIIFSNDCTDGSDELLDQLDALGEIQHHRNKPEKYSPQISAEHEARRLELFENGDWVMWLDIDEYLVLRAPNVNVADLVEATKPADAIGLNWRLFGDSGVSEWPGRQISEQFTHCAPVHNRQHGNIKTLFQYSEKIERLELHRPVLKPEYNSMEHFLFVNGGNRPEEEMPYQYFKKLKDGLAVPKHAINVRGRYRLGQVNHYMVRTADMFELQKKRGNGYFLEAAGDGKTPENRLQARYDDSYFQANNRNAKTDTTILERLPELEDEIERIQSRLEAEVD